MFIIFFSKNFVFYEIMWIMLYCRAVTDDSMAHAHCRMDK